MYNNKTKVVFESDDLSEVKEKINAFRTLYNTDPEVYFEGPVFFTKNDAEFGRDNKVRGWTRTFNDKVRTKYFSAKIRDNIDATEKKLYDEISPVSEEESFSDYGATRWKLEANTK